MTGLKAPTNIVILFSSGKLSDCSKVGRSTYSFKYQDKRSLSLGKPHLCRIRKTEDTVYTTSAMETTSKRFNEAGAKPNGLYVSQTRRHLQAVTPDLHVKHRELKHFPVSGGTVITKEALCLAFSECLTSNAGSNSPCCSRHQYFSPYADEPPVRSRNDPLTNENRCHSHGSQRQRQTRRLRRVVISLADPVERSDSNRLT